MNQAAKPSSDSSLHREAPDDKKIQDDTILSVAAGLLWNDKGWGLMLYLFTVFPTLLEFLFPPSELRIVFMARALDRLCKLSVLFIIGTRALRTLAPKRAAANLSALTLFLLTGFIAWGAVISPIYLTNLAWQKPHLWPLTLLTVPILAVGYLYFFYFFAFLLGIQAPARVLNLARTFTRHDMFSPVKVIAAPAGLMYLLLALVNAPFPDEREFFLALAARFLSGLFWWLSSYLAIATCIIYLPNYIWRDLGFGPYRQSRLSTIGIRAPRWLVQALAPKNGLLLLTISALLTVGNYTRLAQMPPSPTIELKSLRVEGSTVVISLHLVDEKYSFRGFQPYWFRLAGATKRTLASAPQSVKMAGYSGKTSLSLPVKQKSLDLELSFLTDRKAADLVQLEDLHLWYAGVRLMLLEMKKAEVAEPGP